MKKLIILTSILSVFCLSSWSIKEEIDFGEILKKADFFRGGQVSGISWSLNVENIKKGKVKNKLNLFVEASTIENRQFALITFLKPKKYAGQKMLLRENSMWFINKNLRRPIPISGRQRLTGSAANADVVSANYYQDYIIKSHAEDNFEGTSCWILDLEAKSNLTSYSRIKYWIGKDTYLGLKAEFYGKSNKLIKTGIFEYKNNISYKSKSYKYISRITIFDNVNTNDKTILEISTPTFQDFSNSKFQKNSLLD